MATGRNLGYTEEEKNKIFDKIIEDICNGLPVRQILKGDDMPSFHHLLKWIEARPEWGERYARAKQESADFVVNCFQIFVSLTSKTTVARIYPEKLRL